MFGLRKILRQLLNKQAQVNTDTCEVQNVEIVEKQHTTQKEEIISKKIIRDNYFFQIGFDFGTSSSKAIIRDLNKERAWVYKGNESTGNSSFLIPSVVIIKNGELSRTYDTNDFYPKHGLYHLKMAVGLLAAKNMTAPIFDEYKNILEITESRQIQKYTINACTYFLATVFAEIIDAIKQKFVDYGDNPGDQIAINMAIPVAHADEVDVKNKFEDIMNTAWILANAEEAIPTYDFPMSTLEERINSIQHNNSDLCFVYPEVSANVQAFINAPAASPHDTTIYFFSDTGAGTVDQSVFTYAQNKNGEKQLNYFAADVYPHGSGKIDILACGTNLSEESLEFWRKKKENNEPHPKLNKARNKIFQSLRLDSKKTFNSVFECLPHGTGVSPAITLKEKTKFIFGGGGHCKYPYEEAVISTFRSLFDNPPQTDIIAMKHPQDLDLLGVSADAMHRLYVAYGLSFSSIDLADNTFPSQNILSDNMPNVSGKQCTCRGINKNCVYCGGSGVIS